jgi:dCMP deaminase
MVWEADFAPKPIKRELGERADWPTVFMAMAVAIGSRSKDATTRVGAVIVDRDHNVLGTGFNGFPRGAPDCLLPKAGPERHLWVIHAEENAALAALAARPDRLMGSTCYSTHRPCARCLRLLYHVGVRRVLWGVNQLDARQQDDANHIENMLQMDVGPA